jgi:hypothetical protein
LSQPVRFGGRALLVFVGALAALLGGGAGLAAAQSPAYDPGSPAGQQYSIPVDAARSTGAAARGAGTAAPSSRPPSGPSASSSQAVEGGPALFGDGVGRPKRASGTAGAASTSTVKPADRSTASAAPSFRPTGSSTSGTLIGLATGLVVLVGGAALASAMTVRRRRLARQ